MPVLPGSPKKTRITRIYVSTPDTTINGRRNWGIPKRVAAFNFVPAPPGSAVPYARIEVSLPGLEARPFFAADLTAPAVFGLTIPLSCALLPMDMQLVQPPLPESLTEPARVGSKDWIATSPYMRGKVAGIWAKGGLEGGAWGDGEGFPAVQPWGLGLWWKQLVIDFPVGEVLEKKDN